MGLQIFFDCCVVLTLLRLTALINGLGEDQKFTSKTLRLLDLKHQRLSSDVRKLQR